MRYFLDSFGCAKNQVDGETLMAFLNRAGWEAAPSAEEADLIIVNSCGFIEAAKRESINALLEHRQKHPGKKIMMAGCLSQRYGDALLKNMPEGDFFFGNRDLAQIEKAAATVMAGERFFLKPPSAEIPGKKPLLERPLLSLPGSAYVKVAEGCDNRCAFCAIPAIRGPLRSRPIREVVEECQSLLNRGVRELCLVGQDLASYGADLFSSDFSNSLPALLEALGALEGGDGKNGKKYWVRFLYLHPDKAPAVLEGIIKAIQQNNKKGEIVPYFDLPFQHAASTVLARMGRPQKDAAAYLDLVKKIRAALPEAVIRSTFMTGFPGETGADFEALLAFQEQAELDWVGVFTYSREEGTAAYGMKERVPVAVARRRREILMERQEPITERRLEKWVGRRLDVLVEEEVEPGLYLGRLPCQAPEVDGAAVIESDGPLEPGQLVPGKVYGRRGFDLAVSVL